MALQPRSPREEWELRKQGVHDLMLPFVKERPSASQMKWQFERIENIVDGCNRLARDGDAWIPEFNPGTAVGDACLTAWAIHSHTGMLVRFVFNGVEISFSRCTADTERSGRRNVGQPTVQTN